MKYRKIKRIILLGAGGREFHNFNVCFRNNPNYQVLGFTAAQIPNIANRIYPKELSGSSYPKGIPIFPEEELFEIIKKRAIDEVIFAYSDVSHLNVMHLASQVLSSGATFKLMGPKETQLISKKPVVSVCAVRTGCGKSKLTLGLAKIFKKQGRRTVIVRHPMPYGDLKSQICQRFEKIEDLEKHRCTIEEREEYEPLIKERFVVFAGVDYEIILKNCEKEADIILWDGGNNDFPFFKPNFQMVLCDPLRPGHEIFFHPGETNLRMANLVIINKVNSAKKEDVTAVFNNVKNINPKAKVLFLKSEVVIDNPKLVENKEVLVIEDGPTVTHGGMPFGAGYLAAKKFGAKKILEPKKWAQGQIKEAFAKYPHLNYVLPALGYGEKQIKELEKTINGIPCQLVLDATPVDLSKIIKVNKPLITVDYQIPNAEKPLTKILKTAGII